MTRKARGRPRKVVSIKKPPMEIAYWEVGVNLNKDGTWSRRKIERVFRTHDIRPGQCVALFNNSKMFGGGGSHPPKCRLYINWNGQPVCCIPAVDTNDQISYQLRLNEWLRATFGTSLTNIDEVFDEFEQQYETHAQRLQRLAKKLRKKAG